MNICVYISQNVYIYVYGGREICDDRRSAKHTVSAAAGSLRNVATPCRARCSVPCKVWPHFAASLQPQTQCASPSVDHHKSLCHHIHIYTHFEIYIHIYSYTFIYIHICIYIHI